MSPISQRFRSSRIPHMARGADRRATAEQRRQNLRTPELRGVHPNDIDVKEFLERLPVAPVQAVPLERRHFQRREPLTHALIGKWILGLSSVFFFAAFLAMEYRTQIKGIPFFKLGSPEQAIYQWIGFYREAFFK